MRTIRIYNKGNYIVGDNVILSANASHHVSTVLRLKTGAYITLFPGNGAEYLAKIINLSRKHVEVFIESMENKNIESPLQIHLGQAISKGDRMEWAIQKAVELGVFSITPLITEYCVVRLDAERLEKKQQQWQDLAIAACEQSGRTIIPIINPATSFAKYLASVKSAQRFILNPETSNSWHTIQVSAQDLTLLIGPEGGFHKDEIKQAHTALFTSIALGPRILRTETATIVALSALQMLAGDI